MSVQGDGSATAFVVVAVEQTVFSFWDPMLNHEVQSNIGKDKPLQVGDWINVIYEAQGQVLDYEPLSEPPFKTKLDENGELNIRIHAFVPKRDFAKEKGLTGFVLSPNVGRIVINDLAVSDFFGKAENQHRAFTIEIIGSMNPEERKNFGTMWIVKTVFKKKKMGEEQKRICMAWFNNVECPKESASSSTSEEEHASHYASIQKFQKTRYPSASSFENVGSLSTKSDSSFCVISGQPTPPSLSSRESIKEDNTVATDDNTLVMDDNTVATDDIEQDLEVPQNKELYLLSLLRDLLNDVEFEQKFYERFPQDHAEVCNSFAKYEHLLD
uniref:C2 tensin-type domain-containing protein n=1 Tax=Steinernema glaseri TaxID=37863 RepID=A0A1I7Y0B5_9BILA